MKLFAGKTVRRNVTIDAHIADNLSALSKISGISQGELIAMGLRQPFMHKLMLFGSDSVYNPISQLMDLYQSEGENQMSQKITAGFVSILLNDILSRPLMFCLSEDRLSGLNAYIYEHMNSKGVRLLPGFCELAELCSRNEFIVWQSESDFYKSVYNVRAYLLAMRQHIDKPEVYANANLMCNLVVMFRDFISNVADPADNLERRVYYYKCCTKVLFNMRPLSDPAWLR